MDQDFVVIDNNFLYNHFEEKTIEYNFITSFIYSFIYFIDILR